MVECEWECDLQESIPPQKRKEMKRMGKYIITTLLKWENVVRKAETSIETTGKQ